MRNPGLEPGSLAALEPESSASANSASSAGIRQFLIITHLSIFVKSYVQFLPSIDFCQEKNFKLLLSEEFSNSYKAYPN